MIKPNALRDAVTAALPGLAMDPERLTISIEKGRLVATGARPQGAVCAFEYRYDLVLSILDFALDPDVLFAAIFLWAGVHQRDLIDRYAGGDRTGIEFAVDVLDAQSVDIEVRLALSEAVDVAGTEGAWTFTHHAEPPDAERAIAEAAGLDWVSTPTPLRQLMVDGEPV